MVNIDPFSSYIINGMVDCKSYFGKNYLPAVIILQIMSFKAASVALSNTAGTMIIIEGKQNMQLLEI